MSWRLSLRPGSFRGIPFYTEEHEGQSGRRVQVHEYPGRDTPFPEDLGQATARYSITAYVLGDAYFAQRDALIRACEQPGPGRLVHPYLGERSVVCLGVRWSERRQEGRIARFSLDFVDAGERQAPTVIENTIATVLQLATAARTAIANLFGAVFTLVSLPAFVAASAAGIVRDFANLLSGLGQPGASMRVRADLAAMVDLLAGSAGALVAAPGDLADTAGEALTLFRRAAPTDPDDRANVANGLADFAAFRPTAFDLGATRDAATGDLVYQPITDVAATPVRQQELTNNRALVRLIQRLAMIELARSLARTDWQSYDAAVSARDRFRAVADTIILDAGDAGDDDAYRALQSLSAAVLRDIDRRGADLTPLTTYRRARRLPSLVVAHQLYQDAERSTDVARRAGARHPLFLPEQGRVLAE